MKKSNSPDVVRVKILNTGMGSRIIPDVDGKSVTLTPGSEAVILVSTRQFRDLVKSSNLSVSETNEDVTGRAVEKKQPAGEAGAQGQDGPVGNEGEARPTATGVLAKLEADGLTYRELVDAAKEVLGDEFPEHPAQPKKREIVELLEARREKEQG